MSPLCISSIKETSTLLVHLKSSTFNSHNFNNSNISRYASQGLISYFKSRKSLSFAIHVNFLLSSSTGDIRHSNKSISIGNLEK